MFRSLSYIFLIFALNFCHPSVFNGSNIDHDTIEVSRFRRGFLHQLHEAWRASTVSISSYPYMVAVDVAYRNFIKKCTGFIIDPPYYIITAAHCVYFKQWKGIPGESIKIRYGSSLFYRDGKTTIVSKIYSDPRWDGRTYHDIAVLQTADPIDSQYAKGLEHTSPYRSQKSLRQLQEDNAICEVIGFGIAPAFYPMRPQHLMSVKINLITDKTCGGMINRNQIGQTRSHRFCAYSSKSNPCLTDGGAILRCPSNPGILGLFAYGQACGERDRPVMFYDISADPYKLLRELTSPSSPRTMRSVKSASYSFQPGLGLIYGVLLLLGITIFKKD